LAKKKKKIGVKMALIEVEDLIDEADDEVSIGLIWARF
jgi:hypothetical protein